MSGSERFGDEPALLNARVRRRAESCSSALFRKHVLSDAEMTKDFDIIQSKRFEQPYDVSRGE